MATNLNALLNGLVPAAARAAEGAKNAFGPLEVSASPQTFASANATIAKTEESGKRVIHEAEVAAKGVVGDAEASCYRVLLEAENAAKAVLEGAEKSGSKAIHEAKAALLEVLAETELRVQRILDNAHARTEALMQQGTGELRQAPQQLAAEASNKAWQLALGVTLVLVPLSARLTTCAMGSDGLHQCYLSLLPSAQQLIIALPLLLVLWLVCRSMLHKPANLRA